MLMGFGLGIETGRGTQDEEAPFSSKVLIGGLLILCVPTAAWSRVERSSSLLGLLPNKTRGINKA